MSGGGKFNDYLLSGIIIQDLPSLTAENAYPRQNQRGNQRSDHSLFGSEQTGTKEQPGIEPGKALKIRHTSLNWKRPRSPR